MTLTIGLRLAIYLKEWACESGHSPQAQLAGVKLSGSQLDQNFGIH